jgi:serine/threonine-protein kinase HipA
MPGTCLYCYNETGVYEVGYHIACAKKILGQYPPPLIPFDEKQLQQLNKTQPNYIIERKKKGAEQARIVPQANGNWEIRTEQNKPIYLPEAEDLCLKMAALAGIKTATHTLIETVAEEQVLMVKRMGIPIRIGQLAKRKEGENQTGSYEQLIKAVEKVSAQPGLDKIELAERLLFAFLAGCGNVNWGTIYIDEVTNTLMPLANANPTSLLQPALANETDLLLGSKRSNITEQQIDRLFDKTGINHAARENSKRKFARLQRDWFEIVEESYLPERLKRSYIHILINRAERLNMM